jgi:uncharacterized circularly permuted ATP-grasp superfamily protein
MIQLPQLAAALPSGADECVDGSGAPRAPYQRVLDLVTEQPGRLADVRRDASHWFADRGITFGVPAEEGSAPIFPFDPIPRVLDAHEWHKLDRALAQRAMALDAFVADCYGAQRALRDGVVPARLVYSSTGYLRDLVGVRAPRSCYCHVAGIDVVRVGGTFMVLEDNVRVPSGIAYALMSRQALREIAPDWLNAGGVRSIDGYAGRLRRCLQRIAPRPWEAAIAVLTPGEFNAAYYEHQMLADAIGGALVHGNDLIVHEEEVFRRTDTGMERVDVIYSRVNAEWIDPLVFRPDSMLGAPGIIESWRRGNVAIANAPGTGVADDKAVYPYVPGMVRYFLDQEPLIDNVPTYDVGDAAQRQHVIANLERMVLKPVDASGGYGIRFGKLLSASQRADLAAEVEAQPRGWLAQEEVALSKAVCLAPDGGLEARCVDLRPFVLLDERPWTVPGGLTRVAADQDTLVVNSSQGGGCKDTWVLTT